MPTSCLREGLAIELGCHLGMYRNVCLHGVRGRTLCTSSYGGFFFGYSFSCRPPGMARVCRRMGSSESRSLCFPVPSPTQQRDLRRT